MKFVMGGWVFAALAMVGVALVAYFVFQSEDEGVYSSHSPSFLDLLIPMMIVGSIGVLGASISVLVGRFYRSPSGRMYGVLSGLSLNYLLIAVLLFYGSLGSLSLVILATAVLFVLLVQVRRLLGDRLGVS